MPGILCYNQPPGDLDPLLIPHSKSNRILLTTLMVVVLGAACGAQPAPVVPVGPLIQTVEVTSEVTRQVTSEVTRLVEVPVTVTPSPTPDFSPTPTPAPAITRTPMLPASLARAGLICGITA